MSVPRGVAGSDRQHRSVPERPRKPISVSRGSKFSPAAAIVNQAEPSLKGRPASSRSPRARRTPRRSPDRWICAHERHYPPAQNLLHECDRLGPHGLLIARTHRHHRGLIAPLDQRPLTLRQRPSQQHGDAILIDLRTRARWPPARVSGQQIHHTPRNLRGRRSPRPPSVVSSRSIALSSKKGRLLASLERKHESGGTGY